MTSPLQRCLPALAALLASLGPASALQGAAVDDVVISEIMYNPSSGDRRDDWIELHNKGTVAYNLQGWRFEDGVVFTFGNVTLGAGQYLVVCADQTRVRQTYGITNTTGNWASTSTLDNGGERLRLLDRDGVEVEDLTYDDRNPWPILADGLGHSLEKRNLAGDNDDPAMWGASAVGGGWSKVSVTGLATSSTLYLYMSDVGTAYVDDIRLYPVGNPGDNRLQNGTFEAATLTPWTATGNHSGSAPSTEEEHAGSRSLKLVATGAGGSAGTSVSQTGLGLVIDDPYTLEFWALLTDPGERIIARLSQSAGQAEPIHVEFGGGGATAGRVNSLNTSDTPPFIYPAFHSPQAPVAADDVFLLAAVRDDVGVASVTAHWDAGTGEATAPMLDDGAHGDGAAADGVYGVGIGKSPTGSIVRYWISATDTGGQAGRFPFQGNPTPSLGFYIEPTGIVPNFQARSNSGLVSDRPPVYHFLLSQAALSALNSSPATYVQGTFIYDGEVFENVRIRHRGQSSLNTPKRHWKVDFNKDHRFLTPFAGHPEVDNINVQSSYGDKSFLREWLCYKDWIDVGQPGLEMWHVRLYLNGAYRGLYVHLETPNGDWLDRTGKDAEGWLWKSYSQAKGGTGGFEVEESGSDVAAATTALGEFVNSMNSLSGAALEDYIQENMDVQSFIDFLAIHQLIHNCDHPAKNYLVYADEDSPTGTWTYYGWDMDLTMGRNFECGGGGVYNDTMRADMFGDPQLLFGTSSRPKCDGPWNGVINGFLLRTSIFREPFFVRVDELLRRFHHPEVLLPLIDDMADPLLPEIEMDWTRNPPAYGQRITARHHVDQLKGFVENRYEYLYNALSNLTAPDLSDLLCTRTGDSVVLSWINNDSRYTQVLVYRDDILVQTLAGTAESTTVALELSRPLNTFRVSSVFRNLERPGQSCSLVLGSTDYRVVVSEDFSPPASSADLAVNCGAQQVNGVLQLTPPVANQAGSGFFRTPYSSADFVADFDLRFDEPSSPGADGLVFAMIRGDPARCGGSGAALGFWGAGGTALEGFGVVFDTHQNAGEPSHNWVGFIDTDHQASGAAAAVNLPEELTGNGSFHVRVEGKDGLFKVTVGNSALGMAPRQVLTYQVPDHAAEDLHFGFTAGTGSLYTRHTVDNFVLQVRGEPPPPPQAEFQANFTSGEAPLTVTFTNLSTGASTYRWTFGDGTSSTTASPQHTYQTPGTYTVSLTATGAGGADVEAKEGYIEALAVLEVDFSADKTVGPRPLSVRFTDLVRTNVTITAYQWTFGDNTTSTLRRPTHIYNVPGEHTVTLRVTAQGGLIASRTRTAYIQVDDTLEADFAASPVTGPAALEVQFQDLSRGATVRSWSWNFGDGATAAVKDPVHVYTTPGTYTVRLVISGFQAVDDAERQGFITVGPPGALFLRGDATREGRVELADALFTLEHLFRNGASPACPDAADANDDGRVDLSDPLRILFHLFGGTGPLPAPFPEPGVDPTADALSQCAP